MSELTKEDCMNIRKWIAATSMMIEARIRTSWSQSEFDTLDKIQKIERSFQFISKGEQKQ